MMLQLIKAEFDFLEHVFHLNMLRSLLNKVKAVALAFLEVVASLKEPSISPWDLYSEKF